MATGAQLAEQAERYGEMKKHMKQVVEQKGGSGKKLSTEERNLLSVAYKVRALARASLAPAE